MTIIPPSFKIESEVNGQDILRHLELAIRTCYKSEDKICEGSAEKIIKMILQKGHESTLEHVSITVRIICDRGVSHEIVRHRIASYSQESTRYCNYRSKGIVFIKQPFWEEDSREYSIWLGVLEHCEDAYLRLLSAGATPQEARSVLPNSLKTEIVMTCNLREWRHFFKMRTDRAAHPQMREITIPMLKEFKRLIPVVFDDIQLI